MKIYRIIKFLTYLLFAVLVFIFRESLVTNLHYLVGSLLIIYGVEELLFDFLFKKINEVKEEPTFYFAFIEIMLGIIMVISLRDYENNCIIWAVWSILREAFEIREIVNHKFNVVSIIDLAESIVVTFLCITMLLTPGYHHAMIHAYLLIVELVLNSAIPLIEELKKKESVENGEILGENH